MKFFEKWQNIDDDDDDDDDDNDDDDDDDRGRGSKYNIFLDNFSLK